MLIFVKAHYLPLIASGRKTTTIRPWARCKLQPGDALSFNGQLRAVITHVERRRFADLTTADARADGFSSRADLRRAFRDHYPAFSVDDFVFVLTFSTAGKSSPHSSPPRGHSS